jgi:hypothetical protein
MLICFINNVKAKEKNNIPTLDTPHHTQQDTFEDRICGISP